MDETRGYAGGFRGNHTYFAAQHAQADAALRPAQLSFESHLFPLKISLPFVHYTIQVIFILLCADWSAWEFHSVIVNL